MDEWLFLWLGVMVVTIVIEIITVGLTSIWLTGGALVALIVCALGAPWGWQVAVFFAVTFVLIYFTRPWALKHMNKKKLRTNYEEVIGREVRVTRRVDNRQGTGEAIWNGMEWSARAVKEDEIFEPEEMARVARVEGVKLMLEKMEKEEPQKEEPEQEQA